MAVGFTAERATRLADMEQRHFWFDGRRRVVDRLLSCFLDPDAGPAADLGCGSGRFVADLARRGFRVAGFDGLVAGFAADPDCAGRLAQADLAALPMRTGSLAAVFALDVLEHVDDAAALAEIVRVLRPGGTLLATVPAMPSLWSHRDVAAGHRRRYTASSFRDVLTAAGLDVLRLGHHHAALVPVLLATRRLGRRDAGWRDAEDAPSPFVNAAFRAVGRAEAALGRFVRWPVGSSLHAAARRP